MKVIIFSILASFLVTDSIMSQRISTWVGGTPGRETNWEEARNWLPNTVPNEHSYVVIEKLNTGHNAQPVIRNNVEVASIQILSGNLTIAENAGLLIDGMYSYSEGIMLYNGSLINKGKINLIGLDDEVVSRNIDQLKNKLENNGTILINNKMIDFSDLDMALSF